MYSDNLARGAWHPIGRVYPAAPLSIGSCRGSGKHCQTVLLGAAGLDPVVIGQLQHPYLYKGGWCVERAVNAFYSVVMSVKKVRVRPSEAALRAGEEGVLWFIGAQGRRLQRVTLRKREWELSFRKE